LHLKLRLFPEVLSKFNRLMRSLLIFISLFMLINSALSQTGVMRVELPTAEDADYYKVIPLNLLGTLVIHETAEIVDSEHKKWIFRLYDTLLVEQLMMEVPVLFGAEYQGHELIGTILHICFVNTRKAKTSMNNFHLVTFDLIYTFPYYCPIAYYPDYRVSLYGSLR